MKPTTPVSPFGEEFPYGRRYVKVTRPDGTEDLEAVPLTLEDTLHPEQDDEIPVNTDHTTDSTYLLSVFSERERLLGPPVALVAADLDVNWNVEGMRGHRPDIAVFVGLSRDPRPTGLLDLAEVGGRCELAVEVVSPSRRVNDVVHKFEHYHKIGISIYVIIDQEGEGGPRSVRAYRWKPSHYAEIESDDQYRIDLPLLGLTLGVRDNRVVCWDLRTFEELGDYSQVVREREKAKRLLEEADRLSEEREKVMEEQVLARQKAERRANEVEKEADRQREEAQRAQKEADRQREEADRQRRAREEMENQKMKAEEEAAKLIRELQEKLRLLQAGADPAAPTAS
jgi:Uma2 family endonuclease